MIKKTLYFGNPAYLSIKNKQLAINIPNSDNIITRPVEDIGIVILDNKQITLTQSVITSFLENNVAIIHCNDSHLPIGLVLNLDGHTKQSAIFKNQIKASEALKKRLWQQTIISKIQNQSTLLKHIGKDNKRLNVLLKNVKSGDRNNAEAQAASYYWKTIFSDFIPNFIRNIDDFSAPNNMLNYGYAILRGAVARALVGSGLLPTLGIFHRNQYNPYCLADDIMEPFRPFIDKVVYNYIKENGRYEILDKEQKTILLKVMEEDIYFTDEHSPLMVGLSRTTASLAACFNGSKRKIIYPKMV
jgi:CRISPR-associated protein Cas1